jgi:hypothetical protein
MVRLAHDVDVENACDKHCCKQQQEGDEDTDDDIPEIEFRRFQFRQEERSAGDAEQNVHAASRRVEDSGSEIEILLPEVVRRRDGLSWD